MVISPMKVADYLLIKLYQEYGEIEKMQEAIKAFQAQCGSELIDQYLMDNIDIEDTTEVKLFDDISNLEPNVVLVEELGNEVILPQ
ncbi:MAG: hypothetical protein K0R73_1276 [Candidatus Midichloriaceae bacterium]|nr:hypothetical protein [Candidatus Midichloriaceae bacterium]